MATKFMQWAKTFYSSSQHQSGMYQEAPKEDYGPLLENAAQVEEMNPNSPLLRKAIKELRSVGAGIQESNPPAELANTVLQVKMKRMCDKLSAAHGPAPEPLRKDKKIDPGCVMNELKGKFEKRKIGEMFLRRTGNQVSEVTTVTAKASFSESSWPKLNRSDQGLSKKWPTSFPIAGIISPAPTSPGDRSSIMSCGRSGVLGKSPFHGFLELLVGRHSPPGYASSIKSNGSVTNLQSFVTGELEQRFACWRFAFKELEALQGGSSSFLNEKVVTTVPNKSPRTTPTLMSKEHILLKGRIAEPDARPTSQSARDTENSPPTTVRGDAQNSTPPFLGAGPRPGLGTELGSRLGPEPSPDSRPGLGCGLGPELGLGLGPGLRSGKEIGTGPGSGPGSGPGLGTHPNSGSAKDSEEAPENGVTVKGPSEKEEEEETDALGGETKAAKVKDEGGEKPEEENKEETEPTPPSPPPPLDKQKAIKKGAPPPPAPDLLKMKSACRVQRQPQVASMFREIMKPAILSHQQKAGSSARHFAGKRGGGDSASVLAEISSKSPYVKAVEQDIAQHEALIEDLAKEIANFKPVSMAHLLDFVKATDSTLDVLSDETAVLKKFNWPKRYNAFREARALYEEMSKLKAKFRDWKEVPVRSVEEKLAEMRKYTDKCMERVYNVLKESEADERKFKDAGIPWGGKVVQDVRHASLCLMEKYMSLCLTEVRRIEDRETHRGRAQGKCLNLLTGTIKFAFRVHQFAGGFTERCSAQFEEVSAKTRALTNKDSTEENNKSLGQAEGSKSNQEL